MIKLQVLIPLASGINKNFIAYDITDTNNNKEYLLILRKSDNARSYISLLVNFFPNTKIKNSLKELGISKYDKVTSTNSFSKWNKQKLYCL